MGTILRVLDGTVLSRALSSKLQELLPGYTQETFQRKPNYAASITRRMDSLHDAFKFILASCPPDPKFTYLTKNTLEDYAAAARIRCERSSLKLEELHEDLENFVGTLVSLIQVAWPETAKVGKAVACLNDAEQYYLMGKGRPNTATLTPMEFGSGLEYVLQIDEVLPAYYEQWLNELTLLKNRGFPQSPVWFAKLQPEQQAYLCTLDISSVTPDALIDDLNFLLEKLATVKKARSESIWASDLDKIHKDEAPLPDWYKELGQAKRAMIKILAGKSLSIYDAVNSFKNFLIEKNSHPAFSTDINQLLGLPQWYLVLSKFHQSFLKQVIDPKLEKGEEAPKLEDVVYFLPSRLRMLPAPPNFEAHRLIRINKDGEAQELADRRYRSSHIVSRDLIHEKMPQAVRDRHSNSNLEQVMRYATSEQSLLLQTLISPLDFIDYIPSMVRECLPKLPPDKELNDELRRVISTSKYAARIHAHNHPYNIVKRYYYTESNDEDSLKLIDDTERSLALIDEVQQQITEVKKEIADLNGQASCSEKAQARFDALEKNLPKFHAKKALITELIAEYKRVLNSSLGSATVFDYEGRELFLSSLEQLIELSKEDYSYGSCVSGKDRKAVELIHTDAMLIYKIRYGTWPTFADSELRRKRFVAIVADLYLSYHQHVLAGQNAPGSEGIKTPYWYLPKDICNEINRRLENAKGIEHDDRLATDNEVKNIFTNLPTVLIPENQLKASLITQQLDEEACTALYDTLYKLTNLTYLFQVPTKTKIARSLNIFTEYSALSEGIAKIKKLMHDSEAGANNVQRLAKIIEIVLNRPASDEDRKPATTLIYEGLTGLCQPGASAKHLDEHVAELIRSWTDCFNTAKERQVLKGSPLVSDDESPIPVVVI